MKLNEIYGGSYHHKVPVSITYDVYDEHLDDYIQIEVEADVLVTPDCYGTGDSPTCYEVGPEKAIVVATKKPFDLNKLSKTERDHIEDMLSDKAQS